MKRYKIFISAQPRAIVYTVSSYIQNGDYIEFIDEISGNVVKTAWTNCIIQEVQQ